MLAGFVRYMYLLPDFYIKTKLTKFYFRLIGDLSGKMLEGDSCVVI